MIDPIGFKKLSLDEKQNFTDEVFPMVKTALGESPTFKSYIEPVGTVYSRLKVAAKAISHPELTSDVNEGDDLRDGGTRSLKSAADHSANRTDPAWATAGQRVLNLFKDFGENMADLSLAKETTAIDNFLGAIDSNPELKKDITTIQGDIWLQDIRDGQQKVKSGIAKRDASKKSEEAAATDIARELGSNIDKLFRYINMKIEFEPTPELQALSIEINKVIARYRKNVTLRATLREKAKKEKEKEKPKDK
ncbi:DUF6261 family protein [uncultured Acetobacteroides sp.]|uniref:DUF6261 family protein n=1 Tax=uncultured Acetobacteroides sp. TaxID=1760811 RepID=UPI0029F4E91B|nr:DUF6261 family protein [uncultured Acetobacteroides sp.]